MPRSKSLQLAGYLVLHVIASGKPSVENLHKRLSLYHVLKMLPLRDGTSSLSSPKERILKLCVEDHLRPNQTKPPPLGLYLIPSFSFAVFIIQEAKLRILVGICLFFLYFLSSIPRYMSKRYGRQIDRTYRKQHKKELGPESVHGFQWRELAIQGRGS